jgi:hypothetical protein
MLERKRQETFFVDTICHPICYFQLRRGDQIGGEEEEEGDIQQF